MAPAMSQSPLPPAQFILFGDSLTQGANDASRGFSLAGELQNAYVRRLDVVNRGFSGYNTLHALEVLGKVFPTPEQASVKFVMIWIGANDANTNPDPIPQYVPIPQYRENLIKILTHPAITAHSPRIILATPPPVEETILERLRDEEGNYKGEVRKTSNVRKYVDVVLQVAKEKGVPVVDVWTRFMMEAGWVGSGDEKALAGSKEAKSVVLGELLYDGLHLSGKGYKIVFDELIEVLRREWPEWKPYKMAYNTKVDWELNWEKNQGEKFWDVRE